MPLHLHLHLAHLGHPGEDVKVSLGCTFFRSTEVVQLGNTQNRTHLHPLYQTPLHLHLHLVHLGHPGGNVKVSLCCTLLCSTEGLMGFCAVVTVTPQWLLHMGDHGTSTEQSEATTSATSRSACSECSIMKEELVDVKCTPAAQQLEMDTLRQLMESMRSHLLTAHQPCADYPAYWTFPIYTS